MLASKLLRTVVMLLQVCAEDEPGRLGGGYCCGLAGVYTQHAICHVPVLLTGRLLHSWKLQQEGAPQACVGKNSVRQATDTKICT